MGGERSVALAAPPRARVPYAPPLHRETEALCSERQPARARTGEPSRDTAPNSKQLRKKGSTAIGPKPLFEDSDKSSGSVPSSSFPPRVPGLLNTPGGFHSFEHRWALPAAVEFHREIGPDRVAGRTRDLASRLKKGIDNLPGVRRASLPPRTKSTRCLRRSPACCNRPEGTGNQKNPGQCPGLFSSCVLATGCSRRGPTPSASARPC